MKFLSVLLLSLIISSSTLYSQSDIEEKAPSHILKTFKKKFPKATTVHWTSLSDGQWEADYKIGEINYWSSYAKNGHWRETKNEIEVSDLKLNVIAVLDRKYESYNIKTAKLIENRDGNSFDLLIEESGKEIGLIVSPEGKITEQESAISN